VSVAAVAGVATFTNLALDGTINSAYKITFTSTRFGNSNESPAVTLTGTQCDGVSLTCQVGDTGPGGGGIFYASATAFECGATRSLSCKYLEAAPSGWNTGTDPTRTWSQASLQAVSVLGSSGETSTATALGWGYRNTLAIISSGNTDPATSAAKLANAYSNNGKTDWFLPSKDELGHLQSNKSLGNSPSSITVVAGLDDAEYWSSSEDSATESWDYKMQNGHPRSVLKSELGLIRPVRSF